MAQLTPDQRRTRDRVERLIGLAAPVLNLVLAAGDRLSRAVEPEDSEYYPVRSGLLETEGETTRETREDELGARPTGTR